MTLPRAHLIVVAHDVHDRGGMERAMAEFLRRATKDFDVTVVSATLDPELRPLLRDWVQVRTPGRPFLLHFAVFWLKAGWRMRSVRGDLVMVLGAIVPTRADVAVVQFCHNGYHSATGGWADPGPPSLGRLNSGLIRRLAGLAERWCYRTGRVRLLTAGSSFLHDEVTRTFPGIPCVVVPNGVELSRFHPDEAARTVVRGERQVSSGQLVVLFVGGQWYRKGLDLVIEALGLLVAEGHDLVLWVDGTGAEGSVRQLARERAVEGRLRLLGKTPDVDRSYQGADIFVLPSAYETFSLAAHEAAATGLPIVATAVGGVAELVEGGGAGILVGRRTTEVAAALRRLVLDAQLRAHIGEQGRRAVPSLTWDRSYQRTLEVLQPLLDARGVCARPLTG